MFAAKGGHWECSCGKKCPRKGALSLHIVHSHSGEHKPLGWFDEATGTLMEDRPSSKKNGQPSASPPVISKVVSPKSTTAVSPIEAALLQLVPKTQTVPMTAGILTSYICGVKRGYPGGLGQWLEEVSLDYWFRRELDPFKEVSGVGATDQQ